MAKRCSPSSHSHAHGLWRQQPGTRVQQLVTGRDVTPHLLTHLAYPDAQLVHLHSLICAAHALSLLRIIAKPSLSASVEEGKQEGTDQKPRRKEAPGMQWSPKRTNDHASPSSLRKPFLHFPNMAVNHHCPPTTPQSVFPVADQRVDVRGVCCLRRVCDGNRRTPLTGESERVLEQ